MARTLAIDVTQQWSGRKRYFYGGAS